MIDDKEKEGRKKGDKPLDTGYPALIPDLPRRKVGKSAEKLEPPDLDDPSPRVIVEEQAEEGTAK